jgi:hypothetical protein
MRINYIGSQNILLVVAIWMLLCWVFGASAAEKWNAKTTARVNLRKNPSSNGVILSIVPKGYRARIIEKQGFWSKIDVEGDIHGKGWVYAEYLEEILSKVNDVSAQPSMIEEIPPGGDRSEDQSRLKIPTAGEPLETAPVQALPEIRTEDEKEKPIGTIKSEKVPMTGDKQHPSTQNELQDMQPKSTAVTPMERPIVGKAVHVAPVQPPQAGINGHPPGVIKTASSEIPNQGNSLARPTDLPVDKKEPVTAESLQPLAVKERAVPNKPAVEENAMQRMTATKKRKGPMATQESMGLVELALKLTSIILTGLVVLYLHRANRIAASHYEALMQFQNRSDSSKVGVRP